MKKYYKYISCFLLLTALLLLMACGGKEEEGAYTIYYFDRDITSLVESPVGLTSNELNTNGCVEELIQLLDTDTGDADKQPPLIGELSITSYEILHNTLYLHFSEDYYLLDTVSQLLCRAAIVRTMVQVNGVDAVYFYVGEAPMTDSAGSIIGLLTTDSFVENPGNQINSVENTTITLYFTDEDGVNLVPEVQSVHYISSISMEKLVVEQLIAGPETDGLVATVPSTTKIISVTTMDGACYVNLDDGFVTQNYNVAEDVVIYSIVDSLFALNNGIGRVMITVNGESNIIYRESISLDQFFTKNLDLIASSVEETREAEVELTGE